MGASQRRHRATLPTEPAWPVQKRALERSPDRTLRRKAAGRRRWFAMLVVVPVLLMLGSVYLHSVAAGLDAEVAEAGAKLDRAEEEGERLEVRVTELSGSARIRELAGKLGMKQPGSDALRVYGSKAASEAEDGTQDGTQQERGTPRQR
jgi:cell division protein FtsL